MAWFDVTLTQLWGIHCVCVPHNMLWLPQTRSHLTMNIWTFSTRRRRACLPVDVVAVHSGSATSAKKILINLKNTQPKPTHVSRTYRNHSESEKWQKKKKKNRGKVAHGQRCYEQPYTSLKYYIVHINQIFSIQTEVAGASRVFFRCSSHFFVRDSGRSAEENAVCLRHWSHKLKRATNK